jgi:hypothetical protein
MREGKSIFFLWRTLGFQEELLENFIYIQDFTKTNIMHNQLVSNKERNKKRKTKLFSQDFDLTEADCCQFLRKHFLNPLMSVSGQ